MGRTEPEKHVLSGFPARALAFYRAMEQNRRRVAINYGFSEMELRALFRIAAAGSATPTQLALELGVTNGALTGISTRLVTAGHVRRAAHPGDRRRLHLELTPAGHTAMTKMHDDFRAMLTPDGLSSGPVEIEAAARVLDELTARMGERAQERA